MHDLRYPRESRDRPSPLAYCVGGPLFAALSAALVGAWFWLAYRVFLLLDSAVGGF